MMGLSHEDVPGNISYNLLLSVLATAVCKLSSMGSCKYFGISIETLVA